MYKILMVEDNVEYATKLVEILKENNYEVTYTEDPVTGIEEFAKGNFDLVISDYKMSHLNGIRFLSAIKSIKPTVKCMLLTGFSSEDVELAALDIYVDKILSKDRSLTVLLKHIEQLLEVVKTDVDENEGRLVSTEENIIVDIPSHSVYKNNQLVSLTRKEFDLLKLFLENKGVALSREEIVEKLWDKNIEEVDIRIVDGHVKKVREKLKSFALMSVRGYGYKWNE